MSRHNSHSKKASKRNRGTSDSTETVEDKPVAGGSFYLEPVPITENHRRYHNLCRDSSKTIVVADGYPGTGKSIVAIHFAAKLLLDGVVKKIVLVRSLEGVGRNPGAYPGTDLEKNMPKLKQLCKYISDFTHQPVSRLLEFGQVEVCGLFDIQGRDLTGCALIVTEAQTMTPEDMYAIVTRGAEKTIIEGDSNPAQCTNHSIKAGKDGLSYLYNKLEGLHFFGRVKMDKEEDIVRSETVKQIILRMAGDF